MLLRSSILRPRGRSVVLASALALGLTGAHACLPTADCTRSRSCPPSGGAVGIIEHWTGGSAGRGGGEGGGAGAPFGGLGGLGGFGGGGEEHPQEPPLVAVGDECEPDGLYSCADHATREQLVCDSGYFVSYDRCPRGQLCDTRPETQGLCQPIIPECDGHEPGDIVCRQSERIVCGADLVTAESLGICDDLCWQGQCLECVPDARPTCEFNHLRSCTEDGQWQAEPCPTATPHCSDGVCGSPPSCLQLEPNCGIGEDEACCASPLVPGGPVDDSEGAAVVSSFRLDRFEVTVGRFRAFRAAWDAGWRPEVGSGKHVHVNGGNGLILDNGLPSYEGGWQANYLSWTAPTDANLAPASPNIGRYSTWTGEDDRRPINFVTAYEAYAFCIWDEGFLPTSAEWTRAAKGGAEGRSYPWGNNTPGTNFELAVYGCYYPEAANCLDVSSIAPVGTARGETLFGQLDMAGNLSERLLASPLRSWNDRISAAALSPNASQPLGGGAFHDNVNALRSELTESLLAEARPPRTGLRCARVP